MRLAKVRTLEGSERLAIADGDRFRPLRGESRGDWREVIAAGPDAVAAAVAEAGDPLEGAEPLAPLAPGKIVCIGLNYLDHIREAGAERPPAPLIFAKFPSAVIGPGEAIAIDPQLTQRVDWEVELGVVIGRRTRAVEADQARESVFGYTVANDVSARDLQFGDGQWTRGKSLDGFCPLGPVIVTADEIADPQSLALRTEVNGELMQDSTTAEMLFGIAELIAYCSRNFTLEPGDLLLTGTPWGCGEFMDPKRSLQAGDEVRVSVEDIGELRNPVVATGG